MSPLKFNTRKLVKDFGGRAKTARTLREHGVEITTDGIDKWNKRSSIPFKSIVTLCVIAKEENKRFEMLDYIESEQSNLGEDHENHDI